MSTKYKFVDAAGLYFITSSVVDWVDVFTRPMYCDILLDSIRFCQKHKGLEVRAWVLMPNHLHMICSFADGVDAGSVIRNMKSFTAVKLIDAIIGNAQESRKNWMLKLFEENGKIRKTNYRYQFWQPENHPILLDTNHMMTQRLDYLHENPVKAGLVYEPYHWKHSSAIDYYTEKGKGLLDIMPL